MLRTDLKWLRLWVTCGIVLLLVTLFYALRPMPPIPFSFTWFDKLLHAGAFAVFMTFFAGLVERRYWPVLFVALLGYGILIEYLQGLVPNRMPDVADGIADGAGLLLGTLFAAIGLESWAATLEKWLGLGRES